MADPVFPHSAGEAPGTHTFIVDTDTASDDAVALIMALRSPRAKVAGITVVSGNVPCDQAVRNALYTVELCGADTPVFGGADHPLMRVPEYAHFFHGVDGLGDQGYAPARKKAEALHAVPALLELFRQNPGATLVTLGPLTNVALALRQEPSLVERVGRCVVMGGAANTVGNVTPAAEFNIWVDPEAAQIVFQSGLPIEMVGWELCRGEANLNEEECARIRALDNPLAHFAIDCNERAIEANFEQSGERGLALPDPVAMAIALSPSICTRRSSHYVEVETISPVTRGMTVVDAFGVAVDERNARIWHHHLHRPPQIQVCWEIDIPGFKQMVHESLT